MAFSNEETLRKNTMPKGNDLSAYGLSEGHDSLGHSMSDTEALGHKPHAELVRQAPMNTTLQHYALVHWRRMSGDDNLDPKGGF